MLPAKLTAALEMAAAMNLVPVFLGDMFHKPIEPDEALKGRLMRLLLSQPLTAYANVGTTTTSREPTFPKATAFPWIAGLAL